jgi:ABC-2 type transport system permease protein
MRGVTAIFVRQALDIIRNRLVLIQFAVFPAVAWVMTTFVAKADDAIPDGMFVGLFATIYAGMTLTVTAAGGIAEDREIKSLRLLVMAGVKPHQYLLGMVGCFSLASLLVSLAFAAIGGFGPTDTLRFVAVMMLGSTASLLLGATIGILAPNQQAAAGLGMPIAMVLGFSPMVTMFNEAAERLFGVVYTQQLSVVAGDLSADIGRPVIVMLANIAVFAALFALAYRAKGLRG